MIWILVDTLLVDGYIWRQLQKRCGERLPATVQLVTALLCMALSIVILCMPLKSGNDRAFLAAMWMLYIYISIYTAKIAWVICDLLSRLFKWRWLSTAGVTLAVGWFCVMWWAATFSRLSMEVVEKDVYIENLPDEFDGYRILQFSDLHTGTYGTDTTYVSSAVDMMNAQRADLIVFTGDIVNRFTCELPPFVKPLSRLRARNGVISILGNHDHLDYGEYPTEADSIAALNRLCDLQRRGMGWTLLRDSTAVIRYGGDSLMIVGVQNIGQPPFRAYGSLKRAYPNLGDSTTKILLTHNPEHWNDSIMNRPEHRVALTLSGHTHAMQFKVLGFSPARWRYSQWGGLYHSPDSARQLYVNIGMGTVGMPARIGATPEITVLTLRKK